jgi:hypothetical protein
VPKRASRLITGVGIHGQTLHYTRAAACIQELVRPTVHGVASSNRLGGWRIVAHDRRVLARCQRHRADLPNNRAGTQDLLHNAISRWSVTPNGRTELLESIGGIDLAITTPSGAGWPPAALNTPYRAVMATTHRSPLGRRKHGAVRRAGPDDPVAAWTRPAAPPSTISPTGREAEVGSRM